MRQMLSQDTIAQNVQALRTQLQRYLALEGDNGAIIVNNADWLAELKYIDFLRDIGRHFSVNRMLTFEAYKQRLETGLSFLELITSYYRPMTFWCSSSAMAACSRSAGTISGATWSLGLTSSAGSPMAKPLP